MDKFFTMCTTWIEEKEYKKIINTSAIIFSLIAPSFSMMFLYKRELFLKLDIFRLMTICLILNVVIFAILYVLVSVKIYRRETLTIMKVTRELDKKTNEIQEELKVLTSDGEACITQEKHQEICKEIANLRIIHDNTSENIKELNIGSRVIFETITDIVGFTIIIWGLYVNDIIFNVELSNDAKIKRTIMYFGMIVGVKLIFLFFLKIKEKIFKHKNGGIV
ncbi:hypothetical protein [Romboutsia sp. MSSM.1001216sp_RTP31141st1_G3_RTP31141_220114]|uniref:hypothetical protein n=1 Tax=unclassified Romboutsia TaxID=2626894 RepID=UPI0031B6180F